MRSLAVNRRRWPVGQYYWNQWAPTIYSSAPPQTIAARPPHWPPLLNGPRSAGEEVELADQLSSRASRGRLPGNQRFRRVTSRGRRGVSKFGAWQKPPADIEVSDRQPQRALAVLGDDYAPHARQRAAWPFRSSNRLGAASCCFHFLAVDEARFARG